ncbi:MAG: phosphoenolpyruvate-utilizing N-terminal domain-containing protein [Polyangiales bacterium]
MIERDVVARIHDRGEARLDALVELVGYLSQPRPLAVLLDEIPARVARVFSSPVCSLYLREGNDLVMRGNVGFGPEAVGEVRLITGDGLVGTAVETMRPVTTVSATQHDRFKDFPSLSEDRFPVFLSAPVPGSAGPGGAVVVQREREAYSQHEVELLVALSGALAPLVERARIIDGTAVPRGGTSGVRRVTLTGRSIRPGRALGIAYAPQRPARQSPRAALERRPTRQELGAAYERAVMRCEAVLDRYVRAAQRQGLDASCLDADRMILSDGRLRDQVLEHAAARGLVPAFAQVARDATRAARITDDPTLFERAHEMSEVCDALRLLALPDDAVRVPKAGVWLCDAPTVFDLVLATRAAPAALVLAAPSTTARTRSLVQLLGVPTVAEIVGLFSWVTADDVVLVDADHGILRVNPTRRERDEARVSRAP